MNPKRPKTLASLLTVALLAIQPGALATSKPGASVGGKSIVAGSPVGDKWAVVVGIADFADPGVPKLKYSSKDARDFYTYLTSDEGGHFQKDHVRLLLDADATKVNIMDALGDSFLPHAVAPGDLVVIYLSTHGSPAGADINGVNYVIPYDTQIHKLFATGLEMSQFLRIIKERVHTNRILLVMDTCYSGAGAVAKGMFRTNIDPQKVASGIGSVVISSSAPDQRSWESDQLQNSYFTRYLIDALGTGGGKTTVETAFKSMKDKVQASVLKDKGELQTPVWGGGMSGGSLMLGVPPTSAHAAPILLPDSSSTGGAAPAGSRSTGGGGAVDLTEYGEHKNKAYDFIKHHKLWDATHELALATEANPESIDAFLLQSDVLDQQGKYNEAFQAANKAAANDKDSKSSEAKQQLGWEYCRLGQTDSAVLFTEKALSLAIDNSAAHNQLGWINEHKFHKIDEAEQQYRKALELNGANVNAMVNLGLLLENHKNRPDEAEKLFRNALAEDADNPDALLAIGHLLYATAEKIKNTEVKKAHDKYAEAEALLRKALETAPANWNLHSELGIVLAADKLKYDQAEAELRKGVELAPERGAPHAMLADFLVNPMNRIDEGEREYRKALELDPSLDSTRVCLGNLLVDYKKVYDESDSQFREGIKTNPRNAAAYVGLSHISSQLYKDQPAIAEPPAEQFLRKAIAIDEKYAYAYDQLGVLLALMTGRYGEAQQAFEKATTLDPYYAAAHYHLGRILFERIPNYDKDRAEKELREAVRLDPTVSQYQTTLGGYLCTQLKQYPEAEKVLQNACETDQRDAEAHYRLGMLFIEHLGRRAAGEKELKKAHELDEPDKTIKAAIKLAFERYVR